MTTTLERLQVALADRYRVIRELGSGGMATVYLAHDLKHERDVAIKVLKPELAAVIGAERFLTEIKTTANLQHPHILPLFDSGAVDGVLFYVMPFIAGETLRDRITREKQLPIADAIRIASEIGAALDYAHGKGVIHRDIKPENVLLHAGQALVADFGIALAASRAGGTRMTETGMSLGTPHYMSPEQAMGERDIDARSDVYALGAVTYEMLLGEPPFTGPTAQSIVAKVLSEKPARLTARRDRIPEYVDDAVLTALEKLPADRFANAKQFVDALHGNAANASAADRHRVTRKSNVGWRSRAHDPAFRVLAAVALAAVIATGWMMFNQPLSTPVALASPIMLRLSLAPGDSIAGSVIDNFVNRHRPSRTAFAISSDGNSFVFVGQRKGVRQLFLRPLGGESASPLQGTEGAESPFFSPNGEAVGYWSEGRLMRVGASGGQPTQIANVARISGASWGDDNRIAVGASGVGVIVFSSTGATAPDTVAGPDLSLPQFLPGGKTLLVTRQRSTFTLDSYSIEVITANGTRKHLLDNAADARYVPTGHIVFGRLGTLVAVPFDASRLEVTGSPVVLVGDVMQSLNGDAPIALTGAMQAAISPAGHLLYLTGGLTPDWLRHLSWLDRQGRETTIAAAGEKPFFALRLSPDGSRVAVTSLGMLDALHVFDFARGSLQTLADPGLQLWPLWSPDGLRIVRRGTVHDSTALVWSLADGSRPASPIAPGPLVFENPVFWSSDGRELFVNGSQGEGMHAITLADGKRRKIDNLPSDMSFPTLSPDGKWLAYCASEDGSTTQQVFVQPWPSLDRKFKVSTNGGNSVVWTRNGAEIVFTEWSVDSAGETPSRFMAAAVSTASGFSASTPRELFTAIIAMASDVRAFDATPDGSRFLVVSGLRTQAPAGEPRVIINWFAELRKLSARKASQ